MTKGNGKIGRKGIDQLDPDHELPESDEQSGGQPETQETQAQAAAGVQATNWNLRSRDCVPRVLPIWIGSPDCRPNSTISASAPRASSRSIASTLWPKR